MSEKEESAAVEAAVEVESPDSSSNQENKEMADESRDRTSSTGSGGFDPEKARLQWTRQRTISTCSDGHRIVLLAVDASENAKIAFDWYMDNIQRDKDLLLLVHCPEAPRLPTFSFKSGLGEPDRHSHFKLNDISEEGGFAPPVHEWKDILDEMNSKTRKLEEDYEGTCIQKKLRYKIRGEAMKNPGEGIIKIADEEKVDLICMGTRGQSGVKRVLLGSVSDFVVRNAHVPVIVVPGMKLKRRRSTLSGSEPTSP